MVQLDNVDKTTGKLIAGGGPIILQHGSWNKVYQLRTVDITELKSYDSVFDWMVTIYPHVNKPDLELLFKDLLPFPPPTHLYNLFFKTVWRGNSDGTSDRIAQLKYYIEVLLDKPVPCLDFCPFGVYSPIKIRRPIHTLVNLDSYLHFARSCRGI